MFREILISSIAHVVRNAIPKPQILNKQEVETGPYKGTNIGFGCVLKAKNENAD